MKAVVTYTDHPIVESLLVTIRGIVSQHRTLEQIINWGLAQSPPRVAEDMIAQDEFTIDVIMRYDDNLYLVYDVT